MDYAKESLRLHGEWKGKIEVVATVPVATKDDLSLAYTPGVAQPCLEIQKDPLKAYELTRRHNMCAVITDGTAVLGLGDVRGHHGRHGCPGTGRHRTGSGHACHGGQMRALQGLWRRGRLPAVCEDKGRG